MEIQSFNNVWDALTDTPAEAANMTARSDLLIDLQHTIRSWGLRQEAASKRLGITRPRLSDLLAGKISKFSLDALVNLASQAGLRVEVAAVEPGGTARPRSRWADGQGQNDKSPGNEGSGTRYFAEEAVVGKTARVVEEVILREEMGEHSVEVRDPVRRTEKLVTGQARRQRGSRP